MFDTYMPKINSSYVKICVSSRPRLARVSPASRPRLAQKFSIVTRAVVTSPTYRELMCAGGTLCVFP